VNNVSNGAEGVGNIEWDSHEVTTYQVGERTTDRWWQRSIDQGFTWTSNNTSVQTYGIDQEQYRLLSEDQVSFIQSDVHSIVDLSQGVESEWDFEQDDPHVAVTTKQVGSSSSEGSERSSFVKTEVLATNRHIVHAGEGTSTSSREGNLNSEKSYRGASEYTSDSEVENGVIKVPGSSNQYSVNDSASQRYEDSLSEHSVTTAITYGPTAGEDSGSKNYSGESYVGSEHFGFFGSWSEYNEPYWRETFYEPYDVTIDLYDESGSLPTWFWLQHDFDTAYAPSPSASPSTAPASRPMDAASVDNALSSMNEYGDVGTGPGPIAEPHAYAEDQQVPHVEVVAAKGTLDDAVDSQNATTIENTDAAIRQAYTPEGNDEEESSNEDGDEQSTDLDTEEPNLSQNPIGVFPGTLDDLSIDQIHELLGGANFQMMTDIGLPGGGNVMLIRGSNGEELFLVPLMGVDESGKLVQRGTSIYDDQESAQSAVKNIHELAWLAAAGQTLRDTAGTADIGTLPGVGKAVARTASALAAKRAARKAAAEAAEAAQKVTIRGAADSAEEAAQAARSGDLLGPGQFDFDAFPEKFPQGVEGTFTPAGGIPENISLKSFREVGSLGSLNREIRRNATKIAGAGRGPATLIAEPTNFTAEQIANFAKNGPIFKNIIQEGVITRIILRAKDGIVEITPGGVIIR